MIRGRLKKMVYNQEKQGKKKGMRKTGNRENIVCASYGLSISVSVAHEDEYSPPCGETHCSYLYLPLVFPPPSVTGLFVYILLFFFHVNSQISNCRKTLLYHCTHTWANPLDCLYIYKPLRCNSSCGNYISLSNASEKLSKHS